MLFLTVVLLINKEVITTPLLVLSNISSSHAGECHGYDCIVHLKQPFTFYFMLLWTKIHEEFIETKSEKTHY